jgi:hypothetical protein
MPCPCWTSSLRLNVRRVSQQRIAPTGPNSVSPDIGAFRLGPVPPAAPECRTPSILGPAGWGLLPEPSSVGLSEANPAPGGSGSSPTRARWRNALAIRALILNGRPGDKAGPRRQGVADVTSDPRAVVAHRPHQLIPNPTERCSRDPVDDQYRRSRDFTEHIMAGHGWARERSPCPQQSWFSRVRGLYGHPARPPRAGARDATQRAGSRADCARGRGRGPDRPGRPPRVQPPDPGVGGGHPPAADNTSGVSG